MLEIPDEIHHQIGEASVNAEVHVCFSKSLIPDFNVDWIFLIESVLEEKRLEEIQQGSPLTEEEDVYYRTTYVESNIQSNGPSEGFKLLELAKQNLVDALEAVRMLCDPVRAPRETPNFIHYFCGESGTNQHLTPEKEALRLTLYKTVAKLLRSYANIANEMTKAGFTTEQAENIRVEVKHYEQVRDEIKLSSGDLVEMKRFEPAMRQLLDMYIHADESKKLIDFDELGLVDLIVQKGPEEVIKELPENLKKNETAVAEAIENNVRKTIVDENPVNPKYYEKMSALLDELIERRRQQAIDYQKYLQEIRELAQKVLKPAEASSDYPASINTGPKRALYDNLGEDEELVLIIDKTIQQTKKADWVGNRFKEREIIKHLKDATEGRKLDIEKVMVLAKAQKEYH